MPQPEPGAGRRWNLLEGSTTRSSLLEPGPRAPRTMPAGARGEHVGSPAAWWGVPRHLRHCVPSRLSPRSLP